MRTYHNRVIDLHYTLADIPKFDSAAEQEAWYAAVGRMVTYGMRNVAEGPDHSLQLVSMGLRKDPWEVDATYHSPILQPRHEDGGPKTLGTPFETIGVLIDQLRSVYGRSFTMGAVLHGDGTWGFHS